MKNTLLLIACMFISFGMFAQEEIPEIADQDSIQVSIGKINLTIAASDTIVKTSEQIKADSLHEARMADKRQKANLTHWGGIDVGVNLLMDKNQSTSFTGDDKWLDTDPIKSMSWSFNLFEEKIRLVKDYVGITTGLGITYNSYGLDDNVRVISNSDTTYGFIADRELPDSLGGFTSFSKNKLRTTYVRVPLLLEFNTSLDPKRSVHVAAGVTAGVRIGSINKIKYEDDGKNIKQRTKDDFNFSPLTLDASVRVGFKHITLFANYGLTPLFEDGKGAEVYPLTVGITLIPWISSDNDY